MHCRSQQHALMRLRGAVRLPLLRGLQRNRQGCFRGQCCGLVPWMGDFSVGLCFQRLLASESFSVDIQRTNGPIATSRHAAVANAV